LPFLADTEFPSLSSPPSGTTSHDFYPEVDFCKTGEEIFRINFKTDWTSMRENLMYIDFKKKWGYKNLLKIEHFPKNMLLTYSMCLKRNKCYRFRLVDKKRNGLSKNSWLRLFWQGKKIFHIFLLQ